MILPFSTQMNGKPTYFVEKISKSIKSVLFSKNPPMPFDQEFISKNFCYEIFPFCKPKHHTIREDKNDRWKPGNKIDFFINCRQKDMFRFAPVLPVVSVQKIEIKHHLDYITIFIDKMVYEIEKDELSQKITSTDDVIETLAQNDGFDTTEDFFAYFNEDFKGKIIHWTDLRY